ncbi:ImmA/IrrE family metallo-endopeptidase [Lachnotalea glycerini]|uniref:ImmA/IrrE family metallo-endopeptidase n=1 Tax=Lachnotalea glycerini TaxID=1763509 RepID=A0A371JBJ1_9FIRM|nr:ImmA/IrrE family metallo-endopeptidase [Lachnotalea glycerini]RDY30131.1 ImmA/IrrE family metallo-endopeptidase [Lachnotalea glycerini]
MTIDYVVNQVEALVKKVGSRNPYVICNELDYKLHYMDLKQRLKAYYFYQSRINNIIIDENVIEIFRPILIAHELGHGLLHREIAMMSGFQELEVLEKRSDKPMEYEANLFAAELLLEDETVLNHLNEYTFFETASMLNVPAALLDFKFAILKTKGFHINNIQIAKSSFLKSEQGAYGIDTDYIR